MARNTLSDKGVAALKPRSKLYVHGDPQLPGLVIRVMPTGFKSYVVISIDPNGKQVWQSIGPVTHMGIDKAREVARGVIAAIKAGGERRGPESFQTVAENWLKRHVRANGLRTEKDIRRRLDKHILPAWGGRDFTSIKRGDVAALLDKIEDRAGPVEADKILAHISKLCNWYATRHNDYMTPIVRGMRRSNPTNRAGKRILDDAELKAVWNAAEANGTFGAFIRISLLTGQRREKVASMRWQDLSDGVWKIPTAEREKGTAGELVLPAETTAIIEQQPRFASSPYVFTTGKSYVKGYSKFKESFDAKCPIVNWDIHDLRRTARSLMSRAGVKPLIAELVLGHKQKDIAAVYDRHPYREEMADAVQRLAGLILGIVHGRPSNVESLERRLTKKRKSA